MILKIYSLLVIISFTVEGCSSELKYSAQPTYNPFDDVFDIDLSKLKKENLHEDGNDNHYQYTYENGNTVFFYQTKGKDSLRITAKGMFLYLNSKQYVSKEELKKASFALDTALGNSLLKKLGARIIINIDGISFQRISDGKIFPAMEGYTADEKNLTITKDIFIIRYNQ